ncbi:hypothetical protein ABIB00_004079 [Bradyrhizobium sp. LB14.3]
MSRLMSSITAKPRKSERFNRKRGSWRLTSKPSCESNGQMTQANSYLAQARTDYSSGHYERSMKALNAALSIEPHQVIALTLRDPHMVCFTAWKGNVGHL